MTTYLLRHGQSLGNRDLVFSGTSDHALTELGRRQAREAGLRMAGARFAHVLTSQLGRAMETADIFLDAAGAHVDNRSVHAELNERDFGSYESRQQAPLEPESEIEIARRICWDVEFAPPGGESMRQTHTRAIGFLEVMQRLAADGDILVVSHGNVLRSMTLHVLGWPIDMLPEMPSRNCLITRLPLLP
jgi:broad specificity phosphatase PhoE